MTIRHLLATGALLGVIAGGVRAQETAYLPPAELIAPALLAQPEVQAALARVQAARAQARGLDVGSYEYEASMIPQRRRTDASGDYTEWEAQIARKVRWPGKASLDREIGHHGTTAAQLRLDDAEHQSARRLLALWMDWIRTARIAETTSAQLALLANERDAMATRVRLGDGAQRDLDLVEAERAMLEAQVAITRAAAEAAVQLLATSFPQLPLPSRIPALPDPAPLPDGIDFWRKLIVERSHEIGIANEDATRQSLVADRARADRRADPSVGVRIMNDMGGTERVIGLVLSVPIGYAHRNALAVAEAANASAMQAEAGGMRRLVEQEAWASTSAAESRFTQWKALHAALAAQEAASQRSRRAWELGAGTLGDYLLAERSTQQVRLAEAVMRADAVEAALRVRVDSHELWHPELPVDSSHPHH